MISDADRMENNARLQSLRLAGIDAIVQDRIDAAKWRALRNCGRIRMLGCAGISKQTPDNYAFITLELWTTHDAPSDPSTLEYFDKFVEIAQRVQADKASIEGKTDS